MRIVAKVADVRWTREDSPDGEVEIGRVTLDVEGVVHGDAPHAGDRIEVPARRKADRSARVRSTFDRWNALRLPPRGFPAPGLRRPAGHDGGAPKPPAQPAGAPGAFRALAADGVRGAADPEVLAVRRAYAIEALPADQKRAALEQALESDQRVLRYYALGAVEDRGALGRQGGAEAIAAAYRSPRSTPDQQARARRLPDPPGVFDKQQGADPTNRIALDALARALLAEPDTERRLQWARYLGSVVLPELAPSPEADRTRRSALIRFPGLRWRG